MAEKAAAISAAPPVPAFVLVVVHPFAGYQRGDRISEPAAIDAVLSSENAHHCNRIAA
jgi:hypothetical protein